MIDIQAWGQELADIRDHLRQDLVSTDGALTVYNSFAPILMTFIGGLGSFFGPIYGSAILTILDELITAYTERVELITGIVFILVVMYSPMGFAGLLAFSRKKLAARFSFLGF